MKKNMMILAVLSIFSTTAFSQEIVKSCLTSVKAFEGEDKVDFDFKVFKKGSQLAATTTQTVQGHVTQSEDKVILGVYSVKEGIKPIDLESDEEISNENFGEQLVSHAMSLQDGPDFEGVYTTGISSLKDIRKVKTYTIGDISEMGSITIVEAYNENSKVMGSFLGGFLIGACK